MAKEIEIEFKNLLTKEEFENLKHYFQIGESNFQSQTNYYFETPTFMLKNHGGALRIRQKSQAYVLTLKLRQSVGHLEVHQKLSEADAKKILETCELPAGEVKSYLLDENIEIKDLALLGELTTNRAEFSYENGLLVLDHSTYFNQEDYELEYEVTDEISGKKHFTNLLKELAIPERETLNKIKRFFIEKERFLGEK